MRVSYGNDGWVGVDGVGLPGPLYVRMAQDDASGRLVISELYIDASESGAAITQRDIRELPLTRIEGFINAGRDDVLKRARIPGPDLSVLASHYGTQYGNLARAVEERDWVAISIATRYDRSDLEEAGVPPVPRKRRPKRVWQVTEDHEFRLVSGPAEGLTDDFLRNVARAYSAAVARGERPNVAIAEQTGYPRKSVERWVYTARLRGIMPRGRKGATG